MTQTHPRNFVLGLVPLLLLVLFGAAFTLPGGAQVEPADLEIPLDTVLHGEPGTTIPVVTAIVPAELVGAECSVVFVGDNNSSVHPGNTLIVSSGQGSVTLVGVEDAPGTQVSASGSLKLGPLVTVELHFGQDGVFSAAAVLRVDCQEPPPPSSTSSTSSTTSTTTSSTSSTSTTTTIPESPPPEPQPCDFVADNAIRDCNFAG